MQNVDRRRLLQLRNRVSPRQLPDEDWQLCTTDVGCVATECMLPGDYYMGRFWETAPRTTTENTVIHRGGSVGSVVANHCSGSGNSVTVTTLVVLTDFW